ncbi:hypothetical protein P872_14720 [Rhodonellum psychrophilum GCM71 = DSM 17998]|uniref:Uncharacterized protein n=1 Tax=Rhodonellum psychrophilum GCM71 = DSM 17998 TaxID=1123057 RepID=U5C5T7_9BACT|nr:hypothetical protein P872_14720 [Rhodonellum psychrophilum GCM71 = DSM 17998]
MMQLVDFADFPLWFGLPKLNFVKNMKQSLLDCFFCSIFYQISPMVI